MENKIKKIKNQGFAFGGLDWRFGVVEPFPWPLVDHPQRQTLDFFFFLALKGGRTTLKGGSATPKLVCLGWLCQMGVTGQNGAAYFILFILFFYLHIILNIF
jgi:hypothetical protein